MEPTRKSSIALLIDADNSPAAKIGFILSELAGQGVVNIRRAYGNWTKAELSGWIKVLHENSIQPMQSFDLVKGKNATDMALLIDAMDILYTKNVETFCLVSSDCDFTPLVQRLRADGKQVIGFGERRTPEPLIEACTSFLYLDKEAVNQPPAKAEEERLKELKGNTRLIKTLRDAIKAVEDEEGWSRLGPVGTHISNSGPIDHRTYGFKKLSDLFSAIDLFEVKKEMSGVQSIFSVRIKKGAGKKSPAPVGKQLPNNPKGT